MKGEACAFILTGCSVLPEKKICSITATNETREAYEFLERVLKLKKAATHVGGSSVTPTGSQMIDAATQTDGVTPVEIATQTESMEMTRQQKIDALKARAQTCMNTYGVSESMGNAKIRAIEFEMEQITATARAIPRDAVIDFQDKKFLRAEELKYLRGDSSKLRSTLGWEPKYTFEMLMDEMIDHWLKIYE